MSKEVKSPQNNSEEVDLVQLLKLIGSGFEIHSDIHRPYFKQILFCFCLDSFLYKKKYFNFNNICICWLTIWIYCRI